MIIKGLKIQIKQILSLRLILVSLFFAAAHAASISGLIKDASDSWYLVGLSNTSGIRFLSIYFLPPMVFSYSLTEEWNNHVSELWIIRNGIRNYTLSKFMTCAVGGFLCVFLGMVFLFLGLNLFLPEFARSDGNNIYEMVFLHGKRLSGYLLFLTDNGLSGAVSAVFGMLCSTFIMSPLTAVTAPLCVDMALSLLRSLFKLPELFDPMIWMLADGAVLNIRSLIVGRFLFCILLVLLMCFIGVNKMVRRIENA